MKKIISNVFKEIQESSKSTCKISGMPSCFMHLDFYTRGFFPGKLYVFAGAPRTLKTSFLLNIAYNIGVEFQYFTRFFSLDSTQETLVKRMLFSACNCSIKTFPYESPDFAGIQRLFTAGEKLKNANFKFICKSILTIEHIEIECSELIGKGVIIIDYFQMLAYGKKQHIVLQKLKDIATTLNVAVLFIYETIDNSHLKKNFLLRNGADSIFLIRNEKMFGMEIGESDGQVFIEVVKQKEGQSGNFILNYKKDSMKFYDSELDLYECENPFSSEFISTC
ncbi:DnaB-like helicase C-terminal domain-containing protein [Solidesulfovibrio sp.]